MHIWSDWCLYDHRWFPYQEDRRIIDGLTTETNLFRRDKRETITDYLKRTCTRLSVQRQQAANTIPLNDGQVDRMPSEFLSAPFIPSTSDVRLELEQVS